MTRRLPCRRPAALSVAVLVAGALLPAPTAAQAVHLDPDDPAWELSGDARVETRDGRRALVLGVGSARRPDVSLRDGTLEFDMAGADARAFLGAVFRAREGGHMEDVYLRLHKSGLPDAVQYSPDYRGLGQWQLYHGPRATAAARFDRSRWVHVRIVVEGEQAAVWVGRDPEPRLVVDRLRTGHRQGHVGFWANRPGADRPAFTAALADIVVRPGVVGHDFDEPEPASAPAGVVRRWSLSAAFPRDGGRVEAVPADVEEGRWSTVEAERSGLVPLDRHRARVDEGTSTVLAGLRLRAASARTVRLDLGFSDDASVFLDGRPLYAGRHGFSHNFPRRQGLVTLDQASVYLPLSAGVHELVVAVSEDYGGWGLVGRIEERDGLEVEPLRAP